MADRILSRLPKQIFGRVHTDGPGLTYVEARESADDFDEEGRVGRYELVEAGSISIENAFVSDVVRERDRGMEGQDDRERTRKGPERRGGG